MEIHSNANTVGFVHVFKHKCLDTLLSCNSKSCLADGEINCGALFCMMRDPLTLLS